MDNFSIRIDSELDGFRVGLIQSWIDSEWGKALSSSCSVLSSDLVSVLVFLHAHTRDLVECGQHGSRAQMGADLMSQHVAYVVMGVVCKHVV